MSAVLSIGSNLGDRLAALQGALEVLRPVAVSGVWETDPWGPVPQDDFLNAVVLLDVDVDAAEAWARAVAAETAAGRERSVRWGPRTLDVDVVTADGTHPELELPHPRAHERAFVLVPWLDVDPDAVLPGHGGVADLVARLDTSSVRPRADLRLLVPGEASPAGPGARA